MLDPVITDPRSLDSSAASTAMPCATAGQRAATTALGEVVAQRQAVILLFGEAGVGKTALIGSFLSTLEPKEFFVIHISATSGEFAGPPSFDVLLEVISRRLVAQQPTGQRPAALAVIAAAVAGLSSAGRTVLLAIDHADHLTNNVIAELTRLWEYLDAPPATFVCIFIGSPTLASRLDKALRRPGVAQRIPEIRVSQPSEDELAALLAYEDNLHSQGPILTPGAIDRINVYAKSNLNWAAPLADAARTLAANQGEREVTPELVRGALFELWSPEQAQGSETLIRVSASPMYGARDPDSATMTPSGMADIPIGSVSGADAAAKELSKIAADAACPERPSPVPSPNPMTSDTGHSWRASIARRTRLWIALAVLALLILIGVVVAILAKDPPHHSGHAQPESVSPNPPSTARESGQEQAAGEIRTEGTAEQPAGEIRTEGTAKQPDQTSQSPAADPAPFGGAKTETDRPQATNSEGEEPSFSVPAATNMGHPQRTSDASSRAPRASTAKKPMPAKTPRTDHKKVPSDKWIQTR